VFLNAIRLGSLAEFVRQLSPERRVVVKDALPRGEHDCWYGSRLLAYSLQNQERRAHGK
jgi:hypothetical protein